MTFPVLQGINSYIVGCKLSLSIPLIVYSSELIVTQWDVNLIKAKAIEKARKELIVTQWDVNDYEPEVPIPEREELIVTQWDVNDGIQG